MPRLALLGDDSTISNIIVITDTSEAAAYDPSTLVLSDTEGFIGQVYSNGALIPPPPPITEE